MSPTTTSKRIRWRKSHSEVKTNDVWLREAAKGLHQLYHLPDQKAQGKPDKKVKVLWVRKLRCTIERWNKLFAVTPVMSATDSLKKHTHQATQNGILIKLGLLESGNLMNWWMIERWDCCLPSRRSAHVSNTFLSWTQERYSGRRRKSRYKGKTCCLPSTKSAPNMFSSWQHELQYGRRNESR